MSVAIAISEEVSGMPKPPVPENEADRLAALRELNLVGTPPIPALEDLTVLASYICEAPIALVTLIEEEYQWYGAKVGVEHLCGTPRDYAFCAHAIVQTELFVVPDALNDARFARNPLVTSPPNIRFYAGMPLVTSSGHVLGTLCVIDRRPRGLTQTQEIALRVLSRQVVAQLELRKSEIRRTAAEEELKRSHTELEMKVQERTKQLADAHNRLEIAIRASSIGLWEWDVKSNRVTFSPEACAQVGRTEADMPKDWHAWTQLMHPDDLPVTVAAYHRYIETLEGDFQCESRVLHTDGQYRWLFARARMFLDAEGNLDRMFGSHIDITQRHGMEERLRQSQVELRALAGHLRTAREEETRRIARELHDEMGASLTGLKLDIGWVERQVARSLPGAEGGVITERLRNIVEAVDRSIKNLRAVCHDLRPAVLDELGLAAAIDSLTGEFETRTGIPCGVSRPETLDMEPALANCVFRILQELLTNVARHAEAETVHLAVRRLEKAWEVEVSDDGRGLPENALTERGRFGLVGIRERVLGFGGTVDFTQAKGGGTRVVATFPVSA